MLKRIITAAIAVTALAHKSHDNLKIELSRSSPNAKLGSI